MVTTLSAIQPFNNGDMFIITNSLLNGLMPIVYVVLGITLAYIIFNAAKSAFGG